MRHPSRALRSGAGMRIKVIAPRALLQIGHMQISAQRSMPQDLQIGHMQISAQRSMPQDCAAGQLTK